MLKDANCATSAVESLKTLGLTRFNVLLNNSFNTFSWRVFVDPDNIIESNVSLLHRTNSAVVKNKIEMSGFIERDAASFENVNCLLNLYYTFAAGKFIYLSIYIVGIK